MREKFLSSVAYSFKETKVNWKGNEVFQFEKFKEEDPRNILKYENQIYLGLTDERMIFLDDLELEDSKLDPDLIIFASRHASKTERPAILIHTTGNWSDDNSFGGEKHDLSQTSALLHRAGFLSLLNQSKLQNLSDFVVDIEVTHHGPTLLKKPLVYIELGSSKKEWAHQLAAKVVSNSIIDAIFSYLENLKAKDIKVGLGFGGTHYAPNFNRLIQNKKVALSFICPKYYVQNLDKSLISLMMRNTLEEIDFFIVDWKGTNSDDKKHLLPLLEDFNIPIKKIKEIS